MLRIIALACLAVMVLSDGMENDHKYQGDMDLTAEQMMAAMEGTFTYGSMTSGRWPGAKIPYFIDRSCTGSCSRAVLAAIADYHRYTCIRFTRRRSESNYIRIYRGTGCHSPVGMRSGGNSISLGSGCHSKGTALHEIGHSLGLYHEQSRPDRGRYVRIHTQNLQNPRMAFNFNIQRNINSLGTPYDLRSMMHYSSTAFAKRGTRTITTINRANQKLIDTYNRISGFSTIDKQQLNLMYCKSRSRGDEPLEPLEQ